MKEVSFPVRYASEARRRRRTLAAGNPARHRLPRRCDVTVRTTRTNSARRRSSWEPTILRSARREADRVSARCLRHSRTARDRYMQEQPPVVMLNPAQITPPPLEGMQRSSPHAGGPAQSSSSCFGQPAHARWQRRIPYGVNHRRAQGLEFPAIYREASIYTSASTRTCMP